MKVIGLTVVALAFGIDKTSRAYEAGTNYSSGDVVTNNGASYQCKPRPNSLWCGSTPSAYEPGVGSAWTDAWLKL